MITGAKIKPYGLPKMQYAYLGFLRFAISDPELQKQYEQDTGIDLLLLTARTPLEVMIDEAAGREREAIIHFIDWVTEKHWGVEEE